MPRYIDADDLKAVIKANDWSNPAVPDVVGIIIDRTPSTDVVPRAEVMRLVGEYYDKCDECRSKIANAVKTEVAREIFAEIEEEIVAALNSNYRCRTEYYTKQRFVKDDRDFINTVNGKISALHGINDFIAELKKKYTEEQ